MKLRLATKYDLSQLKIMFDEIVKNMCSNGITFWNEYYPYEEFERDIDKNNLYLIVDNEEIISAFALFDNYNNNENVEWESKNANVLYFGRFGVNINYLHQGFGSKTLDFAKQIAKEKCANYLRLFVVNNNIPAIKLYLKNGFKQVKGLREEFIKERNLVLTEFGFESKIK